MQSDKLIQNLIEETRHNINQVQNLSTCSIQTLTWRQSEKSWSILECIEHLNLYGDFYLRAIAIEIGKSNSKSEKSFKSGILGKYFAQSMLPKEKLNKMKTFKDKNPLHAKLEMDVIERFVNQQITLLDLLQKSNNVSLSKTKIPTSISSIIRLNLGDTFQFFINHIARHLKQIEHIQQANENT